MKLPEASFAKYVEHFPQIHPNFSLLMFFSLASHFYAFYIKFSFFSGWNTLKIAIQDLCLRIGCVSPVDLSQSHFII